MLEWGFLRLLLCLQLRTLSRGVPSSNLEKGERLILGHTCIYSWKRHALCYAVFDFVRNRWLNTLYGIVWETKYGRFTTLNIPKCEHFTLLVCPLRFLVISAMRRLGNVQNFKHTCFAFGLLSSWYVYMANCYPGWVIKPNDKGGAQRKLCGIFLTPVMQKLRNISLLSTKHCQKYE